MGTLSSIQLPRKNNVGIAVLLLYLCSSTVWASCHILRCNSDFVAATLDLGSSGGAGTARALSREAINSGYCRALRSYATCTKRTARACRGDLAYHSAVQGIEDLLIQHRCPRAGPTAQPRPLPQAPISKETCIFETGFVDREGRAPEYVHCSVFGDPHIRTFNNDFQTCAVEGAWPLIDNEFLYVQATSTSWRGAPYVTILSKITIIFKTWHQCTEQQLYQAELGNVPAAFMDGSVSTGERHGHHSLVIHSQSPGHAEIHANHIGTVLVVRQSGHSLGISVRSPRTIVESLTPEQDLQLCVWGCPESQKFNPLTLFTLSGLSGSIHAHCSALLPTNDVYQQACMFDLLATGDLNSSIAAVAALDDARRMVSEANSVHLLPVASAVQQNKATLHLLLALLLQGIL